MWYVLDSTSTQLQMCLKQKLSIGISFHIVIHLFVRIVLYMQQITLLFAGKAGGSRHQGKRMVEHQVLIW
jgi:hypothetical protein